MITIAYTVEKNISPEEETQHRKPHKRTSKFAVLDKMDIGDSFVVGSKREVGLARAYAKRYGMKVSAKRIDVRKHRIWKVET